MGSKKVIDWPCQQIAASEKVCERLRDWRKEAIKDQEEFLANQKAFPIEGRWCKEAARHSLKIQRACSLALGWFEGNDAAPHKWPVDLAPEIQLVAGRLIMEFQ